MWGTINSALKNENKYVIIAYMVLFDLVIAFFLVLSISLLKGDQVFEVDFLLEQSFTSLFFLTVIFGPTLETFIFQFLIIESMLWLSKKTKFPKLTYISIFVSGVAFGLSHSYNSYYIFVTTVIVFLYGFYYLSARNHPYMNAFGTVCIVHSISNLVSFLNQWIGFS